MKISFVGPSINFGGAENYTLEIARACKREGYDCKFIYHKLEKTTPLFRYCNDENIDIVNLPIGDSFSEIKYRSRARRFLRRICLFWELLVNRPDLCFVTLPSIQHGYYILTVLASLKIRTIVVFQYVQEIYKFTPDQIRAYRIAKRSNQEWVAISMQNRRLLCDSFKLVERDIHLINNGVRIPRNPTSRDERPVAKKEICSRYGIDISHTVFCTVAALRKQKGHKYLLESIPIVLTQKPNTHWLIVGDGDLRMELEKIADKLGIQEKVTFCGYQKNIISFLNGSDYFVFPTLYEGQPFALMEAIANKIPCISTDASGIGEILTHRESALVCEPGDSEKLAVNQLEAINNPNDMLVYSNEALKILENYSFEGMITQTLDLIRKSINV